MPKKTALQKLSEFLDSGGLAGTREDATPQPKPQPKPQPATDKDARHRAIKEAYNRVQQRPKPRVPEASMNLYPLNPAEPRPAEYHGDKPHISRSQESQRLEDEKESKIINDWLKSRKRRTRRSLKQTIDDGGWVVG